MPALRYQFDEGDADPATFFYYLGLAAAEASLACNELISLTSRQPQRCDIGRWIERTLACARQTQDANLRMYVEGRLRH